MIICPLCHGAGQAPGERCPRCRGVGEVYAECDYCGREAMTVVFGVPLCAEHAVEMFEETKREDDDDSGTDD